MQSEGIAVEAEAVEEDIVECFECNYFYGLF
jgi:hypothetical protein